MSEIDATVTGCEMLLSPGTGGGARKAYHLVCSFGAYTESSDDARITGVAARITERMKDGKTRTFRSAAFGRPGKTAAGVDVYAVGTITNASGTLTFDLGSTTAAANRAASAGVGLIVVVDEA
jgi:hypothetical protein